MVRARIAAMIGCAALVTGCGGGATPGTLHAAVPATVATSAPSGAPLATARLTLAFPANFHIAHAATATKRATATTSKRKPAYVNPSDGDQLDVFVDGVDETPGLVVSNTSDGTQTVTLSIYSTTSHQIVAVETEDGLSSTTLAIGETDLPAASFAAGDVTAIGLTMLMNAVGTGITKYPQYGDDATTNTSPSSPYIDAICSTPPAVGFPLYLFAYDDEMGFISNPGAGVAVPSLSGYADLPGTEPPADTVTFPQGLGNGFVAISYRTLSGGVQLNTSVINPAAAITQDVYQNGGSIFPGIYALYQNGTLSSALNTITNAYGQAIATPIYIVPMVQGCG